MAGSENVRWQGTASLSYKRPLLAAGLVAVGVTVVALSWAWWLSLIGFLAVVVCFCVRRRVLFAVAAAVFFVLAMGYRHWYVLPTASLNGQTDTFTAVVEAEPTYGDMYTVRVTQSTVLRPHTRVMLLCNGEDTPRLGGAVTASVQLYTVSDNQRYYYSRGAVVCAFAAEDEDVDIAVTDTGLSPSADGRWWVVRALMAAPRRYLEEAESSILVAMCFGQRAFLSDETAATFQHGGLSHLLVVSGLHLSMMAVAMRWITRRFGMRLGCVVTLLSVWLFGWLVGFSPSVLRAALMVTVWLVGSLLFCRSDGLNSLGLAAMLVLVGQPYTVWNVGFQLSFAATFGVLLLAPRLVERYAIVTEDEAPWWRVLWQSVRHGMLSGASVCVAALLFTLPIAAYHYGGLPLSSVVSNVLAIPVAGAILLLGWLGALCGLVPFLGWLSQAILLVAHWLVRYLMWVAELCSPDWCWLTVSAWWEWVLLLGVCALLAWGIAYGVPFHRVAAGVIALVVLAVGVGYPLVSAPVSLTVIPSDNAAGFVLRQGNHCALLLTDAAEWEEVTYLTSSFTPDTVFVGQATAATVGHAVRYPAAQVLSATEVPTDAATYCPVGSVVHLWEGCDLTVYSARWWRLQTAEQVLWIATDPTAAAPDPDGVCIYVGGTPTNPPSTAYTVVCSGAWLRRHHPTLTGRETFVIENPITLIPHRGEWRMSLWL